MGNSLRFIYSYPFERRVVRLVQQMASKHGRLRSNNKQRIQHQNMELRMVHQRRKRHLRRHNRNMGCNKRSITITNTMDQKNMHSRRWFKAQSQRKNANPHRKKNWKQILLNRRRFHRRSSRNSRNKSVERLQLLLLCLERQRSSRSYRSNNPVGPKN